MMRIFKLTRVLPVVCLMFYSVAVPAQVYYAEVNPGKAVPEEKGGIYSLRNDILAVEFTIRKGAIQTVAFRDYSDKRKFIFSPSMLFNIALQSGTAIGLDQLRINHPVKQLKGRDEKGNFVKTVFSFTDSISGLQLTWQVILYDEANYVIHQYNFQSAFPVKELRALSIPEEYKPVVYGKVAGSPVICGNTFWAIENPMFAAGKKGTALDLTIQPFVADSTGDYEETMVWGTTPDNGMRRGFLYYLEHRRPAPYNPYIYYDSWYDLSYGLNVLTEQDCTDRVRTWGDSLAKRGAALDCFLWDSGWDDWYNMWEFNKKMPDRFRNINTVAGQYNARSGAWLSPWGGYDEFIVERLAAAKKKFPQYRINERGFTLTDTAYYNYFRKTILDLIKYDKVALFKIDGVGDGKDASSAGEHSQEMHAFIRMMKEIRRQQPTVRLNLTVGTWPSPFWLFLGDNIWKGGEDYGASAEGNKRQQWMNFRDAGVYNCISRAPLCPVSSLMFHGITIANYGATAGYEMDDAYIADDIWAFFGNGSSLQELYINPHKLSTNNWNELARAIRWSRSRKGILVDSHWIGGNPSGGEVYGFGSWNPDGAVLMLRNPGSETVRYTVILKTILQLPESFNGLYQIYDVRQQRVEKTVHSLRPVEFLLRPFEVKVLDLKLLTRTMSERN